MTGSPIKLSDTPVAYAAPPPLLGQHTQEVLRNDLGLSDSDIATLIADQVVT